MLSLLGPNSYPPLPDQLFSRTSEPSFSKCHKAMNRSPALCSPQPFHRAIHHRPITKSALFILFPLTSLLLMDCTLDASPDPRSGEQASGQYQQGSVAAAEAAVQQHVPPGKTFFAEPGIYVEVPAGYAPTPITEGILFNAPNESSWFALYWDADPQATYRRLVEGVAGEGELRQSNGVTEDLGNNRTAFVVIVLGRYTGRFKEGRYVVMESGHAKGGFMGVAAIDQESDPLFEQAKARLLAIMNTVEHIPEDQVAAILEQERQSKQRATEAALANVNNRKRTAAEVWARQALMGKALVKVSTTSSNSSSGYASQTTVERFQLCPDGVGLWTYSSDMNVDGKETNMQGDVFDTGNLHGTSKDRRWGTWDVEHHREGPLMIVIYSPDGSEGSWFYQEGADAGACTVGGKVFRVCGPGDSYGPECE